LDREIGAVRCSFLFLFRFRFVIESNRFFSAGHIGEKVREMKNEYEEKILMWCKEETLDDGSKLTDVINHEHENVKYLPDQKLPENIVAVADLSEAVKDADILIFVIPHQFVKKTCEQLKDKVKKTAFALTLIKVRL
jgi:glycerol-3-phosphate dehydrogenase (NAD+)